LLECRPYLCDHYEVPGIGSNHQQVGVVDKAYLKDKLFSQERDSQGRRILRYARYMGEELAEQNAILPGRGLVTQQTQEITPSLTRILANVYESACNYTEQAGGDTQLIEACRREAT
jgi:hypothetical protein